MAVPKRKTTPSKQGMRRAHDRMSADAYVENRDYWVSFCTGRTIST